MTNSANPMPNGASSGRPSTTKVAATPISATTKAPLRRCATPPRSPRFHASSGPNGNAIRSVANSGPKVALKKGGPTEIFSPVSASSASG